MASKPKIKPATNFNWGRPYYFTFEQSVRPGSMDAFKLPSLVSGSPVPLVLRVPCKEAVHV